MPRMRIIAGKWKGRIIAAPPGLGTRPILDRVKTVLFDLLGHRLAEPGRLPPLAVLDLFSGSGALGLEALSRGAAYCLFVERNRGAAALLRRNLDSLQIIREAHVLEAGAITADFSPPPVSADTGNRYGLVFLDPPYRMLSTRRDPGIAGGQSASRREPESWRHCEAMIETSARSGTRPGRRVGGTRSGLAGHGIDDVAGRDADRTISPPGSARGRPSADICRLLGRLADDPVIDPSALIVVRHDFERGGGPDLAPLVDLDRRDVGSMTLRFLTRP
jgi:16S rRNA (guanine(966)-N(2))-methyltransferase RsmD